MKYYLIGLFSIISIMLNGQCIEGDCTNGFGIYKTDKLVIKKDGTTFREMNTYTGFFKDSLFHGVGVIDQSDGGKFKGGFQEGQKHGVSILTYTAKNYSIYAQYEEGKKNGYCFATVAGDLVEAAKYKKGEFNKDLSLDYTSKVMGNRCLGNCVNGFGLKVFGEQEENNYFSGFWWKELPNSIGIRNFASGELYKGGMKSADRQGVGEYSWPSGAIYFGEWNNNEMAGYGMFIEPDGTEKFGLFKKGKFIESLK